MDLYHQLSLELSEAEIQKMLPYVLQFGTTLVDCQVKRLLGNFEMTQLVSQLCAK